MKGRRILFITFGIGSAVFLTVGSIFTFKNYKITKNGQTTTGIIVENIESYSDGTKMYKPVVRYKCGTGTYKNPLGYSSSNYKQVGSSIQISCMPQYPDKIVSNSFADRYMGWIFLSIGVIELLLFLFFVYKSYKKKIIKRILKNNYKELELPITAIKKRFYTVNDKSVYFIQIKYFDDYNDKQYTFESKNFYYDISTEYQIGQKLKVRVHPNNYKYYYIVLDK